jgi:hypothetical protein
MFVRGRLEFVKGRVLVYSINGGCSLGYNNLGKITLKFNQVNQVLDDPNFNQLFIREEAIQ